jgi:Xaa-Pro aminopeptidase
VTATAGMTRADRLAELLDASELDALLVTDLVNVRYLTGYTGTNGIALVGIHGLRQFVTDFRYVTQAEQQVHGFALAVGRNDLLDDLPAMLPDGDVRLGFEDQHVAVRTHRRLRELLAISVELVPAGGLVEDLRAIKDAQEVARVRAAAELAEAALRRVLEGGLAGRSERTVAVALEEEMRRLGAERPSFDTIVASGEHGALPHAVPRDAEIAPGTLVTIDWGAQLDGYCSDCTRTY